MSGMFLSLSLSKYWHSRLVSPQFLHHLRLRCSPKVLIRHLTHSHHGKDIYTLHSGDQLPFDLGSAYARIPGVEFPTKLFRMKYPTEANPCFPCLKSYAKVALGFGFDPITDDYKIVGVPYARIELNKQNTYIYSLKTDCWSAIPSPSTRFYNVESKPCFFNGVLHLVVDGCLTTEPSRSRFILTFNLSSHVFGHILLPEPLTIRHLTTINGFLAVVSWDGGDGDCWIWVMKEYGKFESWSVRYKPETEGKFEVTGVFQLITNGDILACYRKLKVYNLETMSFTKLIKFGACCSYVEMEPYVESLELVDKEGATTCGETILSWTEKDTWVPDVFSFFFGASFCITALFGTNTNFMFLSLKKQLTA
ncbi:hypothetical protein L1987_31247 [Smallanthus sonchifolius]|uniref:Uncharacterized protein n=1 Tax=Smallanthus sonchifolius TaxID=185202 RepID=A0ACB9I5Z3_9ASTR|nr:hypothetical protein L1987_31247 [Smallanthus sonchifolius]